uniref:RING-type domain-containing protein n=1 Tax=Varanus komodoensis TaxID=61221 RepID=A0A8D2JAN2_VARKO
MASVREVSSIAEDLLCPICLSIFQDPHMLACSHNFCFSCLESCFTAKGQHKGLCPECRAPFDLQDAVRNRVLSNLSEKCIKSIFCDELNLKLTLKFKNEKHRPPTRKIHPSLIRSVL